MRSDTARARAGAGRRVLAAAFCAGLSLVVHAQPYPSKPVRLIVPFSAGSGSDTIARIASAGMAQVWGRQVVVENRAGASGNIGAELAAKSAPDGYTLLLANMGHAASAALHPKMSYDLLRDFEPVTQVATAPSMLVVHPSLPAKSLGELVKLAKARPGAMNFGSAGIGTSTFVAGELFKSQAGVDLMHVPYKSGGEAIIGVLTGETSVYFAPFAVALPHARAGRLRPLAVTAARRVPLVPDYPTVAELGYPGYQAGNWYGLLVPAGTSGEIVAAVRNAAVSAVNASATGKRMTELGYVIIADQPAEFAAHMRSEIAAIGKVLRGIRID